MIYYRHKKSNRPQGVDPILMTETPPDTGQVYKGGFSVPIF